jgi:hypothetical protein
VAQSVGDKERAAHGHFLCFLAHVMVGDLEQAAAELDDETRVALELRQPAQLWQLYSSRAMLMLAAGLLEEAEPFVSQAFVYGERSQPELAIPVY